jgi:putative transposase
MRATPLTLTTDQRQGLENLVRRHSTPQQPQQVATRARIVLAAAEGQRLVRIAEQVGLSRESVRLWRDRWVALQDIPLAALSVEQRLADAPRPGAPARITAEQVCQVVALACEAPAASGRPISQWTHQEIAAEIMRRGIVATISPRHAARLVKRGTSNRT